MVAAGVFLVARIYPLMAAAPVNSLGPTAALQVVTWIGAITALFGATIAVAQWDIKRILAYSTVSQLGYMMMGLGVGGVSVGMFHLITHAFFKALLFLGAGSVIHGCSGEQDIRRMGGLRRHMRVTFLTYMAGMLALCGFPFFFSGFWSKDAILHAAHNWSLSQLPFYMGALGAVLTAFNMTRQVYYVFAGTNRLAASSHDDPQLAEHFEDPAHHAAHSPHESPAVMTIPLVILAAFAVLLGFVGTPAWPWFQSFLEGTRPAFSFAGFSEPGIVPVMISSSLIVFSRPRPRLVLLRPPAHHKCRSPRSPGQTPAWHFQHPRPRLLRGRDLRHHLDPPQYLVVPHLRLVRSLHLERCSSSRLVSRARRRLERQFRR